MTQTIGYISAPTGSGHAYATGQTWGHRGRRPRWHATLSEAQRGCRAIERTGWRDGGRGRDCYIVSIVRTETGVEVCAGGDRVTGLALTATSALTVGCSLYVRDACEWLRSLSARRKRQLGIA